MTDEPLLQKKLAFIESCLRELDDLANPELMETDLREQRFIAHTMQLAIQATLDVASHIVSDQRLGEPSTNQGLFTSLCQAEWISRESVGNLRNMAGFRNILVHGYQEVDITIMRDVFENHLVDLKGFVDSIRARLSVGGKEDAH